MGEINAPVALKEQDLLHRLRRIEGQIRGLEAMVQRHDTCHNILTQVAAVHGALGKVARMLEACSMAENMMQLDQTIEWDLSAVRDVIDRVLGRQS